MRTISKDTVITKKHKKPAKETIRLEQKLGGLEVILRPGHATTLAFALGLAFTLVNGIF